MLDATPEQIKDLGQKITSFIDSYGPNDVDAVLFVDGQGKFGFSAGPEAPAGCKTVIDRGGIDRLMVGHGYLAEEFAQPDRLRAFVDLLYRNRFES